MSELTWRNEVETPVARDAEHCRRGGGFTGSGTRLVAAALGLVILAPLASPALGKDLGMGYVIRHDKREFRGRIEELPDCYKITSGGGITMTVPKKRVAKVVIEKTPEELAGESTGDGSARDSGESDDALPMNRPTVEMMKRLLEVGDANVITRDHFVVVHSADRSRANQLASRLEKIWRWNESFLNMLGVTPKRPDGKLNIIFFGSYRDFEKHLEKAKGRIPRGSLGMYNPGANLSMFYDLTTHPDLEKHRKEMSRRTGREQQIIRGRINNITEYLNCTVIQHEATHHMHFNTGLFARGANVPVWLAEGFAMMFEAPPGPHGGSLGTVNAGRLEEWHEVYGKRRLSPKRLRALLFEDKKFRGGQGKQYSVAWALTHYLWKHKRDEFTEYVHGVARREPGIEVSPEDNYAEFVKAFGKIDGRFIERWYASMDRLPRNSSALPWQRWKQP